MDNIEQLFALRNEIINIQKDITQTEKLLRNALEENNQRKIEDYQQRFRDEQDYLKELLLIHKRLNNAIQYDDVPTNLYMSHDTKKIIDGRGKNPCWKGYEPIGMKNKNGKSVPNCVPTSAIDKMAYVRSFKKK